MSAPVADILQLRDEVLERWEVRLRQSVKAAAQLPHPIIIDTFPAMYERLCDTIRPDRRRSETVLINTVASEHGGERARLTDYDAQAIITEYELLRTTLFELLQQHGIALAPEEANLVDCMIDDALREAVMAFALAQSVLRERAATALVQHLRHPLETAQVAGAILQSMQGEPNVRQLCSVVNENLAHMERLIQDVLGRLVFHAGERLQLHLATRDMLRLAKEVAQQATIVHGPRFEVTGAAVAGCWDRKYLKLAIEHLLENAIRCGTPRTLVRINVKEMHQRLIVTVRNEGPTIPAEQLESVFQVYRRAVAARHVDTARPEWGMGLPFVRCVAESHGGSVGISSRIDLGTIHVIDIPVDARPFKNAPTVEAPPPWAQVQR